MVTNIRQRAVQLTECRFFKNTVIVVIIANSITLGLETYPSMMASYGTTLTMLDQWFLLFFVVELLLKLYAQGARAFAQRSWNWFDTIIVLTSFLPFGNLSALRALRLLRLLNVVPAFRQITESLLRAAIGAASVFGLLGFVLTVSALLSSKLFGKAVPELFGNFHISFLTHFQLMVFDNWRDVVNATVDSVGVWTQWYLMTSRVHSRQPAHWCDYRFVADSTKN